MKNSFFLVIPEQKSDPQLIARFSDATLAQWIAELPTANPGLATRLFQEMLAALITLEMPSAKRLNVLEQLRPNFLIIEDYLRSRLTQTGFPKGNMELRIFNVLLSLEKHLTIGYWNVVRDMTRKEIGWRQGKATALCIQRTVEGLSSIIISHYMMSLAVPNWIWIDLHSLYKLSVKIGKESTKISEPGNMFGGRSVEDRYKQILLLSLAYPSGLMQKEFLQVYQFTEKLCDQVQIEPAPIVNQAAQCSVFVDEDLAPGFMASKEPENNSDSARIYLNLEKLHKIAKQAEKYCSHELARFSSLGLSRDSHANQKLPAELFGYLMQRWYGIEPQGTAYFKDRLDRYVALGLEATHQLQDLSIPDAQIPIELEKLAVTHSDRALVCSFEDRDGVLSIGSLISIRKKSALPHQRSLGVVCKIQMPKQDCKLIFEMTVIAAQSFSVTYLHSNASSETEPKKALMYYTKTQQGEKSFIIMESFMLKNGDILKIFMGKESFSIILYGRRNIGLGFWQFECRKLMDKELPAQEQINGYDFI